MTDPYAPLGSDTVTVADRHTRLVLTLSFSRYYPPSLLIKISWCEMVSKPSIHIISVWQIYSVYYLYICYLWSSYKWYVCLFHYFFEESESSWMMYIYQSLLLPLLRKRYNFLLWSFLVPHFYSNCTASSWSILGEHPTFKFHQAPRVSKYFIYCCTF